MRQERHTVFDRLSLQTQSDEFKIDTRRADGQELASHSPCSRGGPRGDPPPEELMSLRAGPQEDRGSQPGSLSWACLVRPPWSCQVNCRQARGPQRWGVHTGLCASAPTFIGEQTYGGSDGREVTLDQDTPGRSWEGLFLPPRKQRSPFGLRPSLKTRLQFIKPGKLGAWPLGPAFPLTGPRNLCPRPVLPRGPRTTWDSEAHPSIAGGEHRPPAEGSPRGLTPMPAAFAVPAALGLSAVVRSVMEQALPVSTGQTTQPLRCSASSPGPRTPASWVPCEHHAASGALYLVVIIPPTANALMERSRLGH